MIRAGINDPDNPVIIMGLSEGNIERLKAGFPIKTAIRSYGVDLPGTIGVIYGKTEADIEAEMRANGLIGDNTKCTVDSRLDQHGAIRRDSKAILICTMGLPRSGKTTWARSQAYPIVNPDSIRLSLHGQRFAALAEPYVWAIAKTMVRSLFLAGHQTVIVDATNTTRKRRDDWQNKEWTTCFQVLPTTREECLERASLDDTEILPVINRMADQWEPLEPDEMLW